ncbi:MAG: acetyl-CoA carboxylase biotin carboxyl carrier protein [Candidatus Korobacteraceae bacterium]
MNQKEIKELIELLVEKDIAEFEMERGDVKLHIKRGGADRAPQVVAVSAPAMAALPVTPVAAQPTTPVTETAKPAPADDEANLHIVKSPIVGTFYEAASPGAPAFVAPGDAVKEGQVLCIIEAMKLMNEIEADATGVIVKRFVNNGSPVEYGMPLFGIRKS